MGGARAPPAPPLATALIYQEFRSLYDTLGMSFSKLLNTLTYHLNMCQQLQDRVIFGGGDAAALNS